MIRLIGRLWTDWCSHNFTVNVETLPGFARTHTKLNDLSKQWSQLESVDTKDIRIPRILLIRTHYYEPP